MKSQHPRPPSLLEALETRSLLAATVIDVMVLYSTDARSQFANNDSAIQKAIRQSLDMANLAHQNTEDNIVLRLVHSAHLPYSNPNGPQATQLAALESSATAANLRNTFGADLVSMVVDSAEGGGLANLLTTPSGLINEAFSVVGWESIGPGNFVLAHELGHNKGGGHERDNGIEYSEGAFPAYSFGYHATAGNGTDYGDVMSYQGATLPVFSWPGFTWQGIPIGSAVGNGDAANLHETFLVTGPVVANYRATVVADAAPTAVLWQSDLAGDQLTFQVRYTDDIAINASTLGDGDAYVTTPEGFTLQAELVSLDRPGDAYAKVATYRVTLPRSAPALSALGFHLNGGQVKDSANAAVPAGPLALNLDADLDRGLAEFQLARDLGEFLPGSTRRLTQHIGGPNDSQDIHKFTVNSTLLVSARLSGIAGGLSGGVTLFIYNDLNGNEQFDTGESLGNSFETGLADRTMSKTLSPGTYYVYLQMGAAQPATSYTLTLQNVDSSADVTPPGTPVVDKADFAFVGNSTVVDFFVIFSDDVGVDPNSVLGRGYLTFFTPAGHGIIKTPDQVTISGKSVIARYNHTFPSFGSGQVQVRLTNEPGFETLVTDLAGNFLVLPGGTPPNFGTYRVGTLPADSAAPTASVNSAPAVVVPSGTAYDFVIAYKDNRGLDLASLNNTDITLDGPAGSGITNLAAAYQGFSVSPGGAFTYVTYRITPPGGAWDYTDNGTWKIKLAASQVKDTANLFAAANANLGTFLVHVPIPGDANNDDVVNDQDFTILCDNFAKAGRGVQHGDLNFDGLVNFSDFQKLETMFGVSKPLAGAPVVAAATTAKAKASKPKVFSESVISRPPAKVMVKKLAKRK